MFFVTTGIRAALNYHFYLNSSKTTRIMAIMLHYFKGVIIYDINMNLATDGIYSNSKKKNYIRCPKTLLFANINIYKFNTAIIIY